MVATTSMASSVSSIGAIVLALTIFIVVVVLVRRMGRMILTRQKEWIGVLAQQYGVGIHDSTTTREALGIAPFKALVRNGDPPILCRIELKIVGCNGTVFVVGGHFSAKVVYVAVQYEARVAPNCLVFWGPMFIVPDWDAIGHRVTKLRDDVAKQLCVFADQDEYVSTFLSGNIAESVLLEKGLWAMESLDNQVLFMGNKDNSRNNFEVTLESAIKLSRAFIGGRSATPPI